VKIYEKKSEKFSLASGGFLRVICGKKVRKPEKTGTFSKGGNPWETVGGFRERIGPAAAGRRTTFA